MSSEPIAALVETAKIMQEIDARLSPKAHC